MIIKLLIIFYFLSNAFSNEDPYILVLGIAQDGGYPHAGCVKKCCEMLWEIGDKEKVTSLGIIDPKLNRSWIIDATPDFAEQYHILTKVHNTQLQGIFLTHAHMGHYIGLLQLGREVMDAKDINVFCMPKMKYFLENNAPWQQLIDLNNISIKLLKSAKKHKLSHHLFIEPFLVPHRDEFSETVGYKIEGPSKTVLFIPDIDKWLLWDQNLIDLLETVDLAFIDGTFFSAKEVNYRTISEIPHPLVEETIEYLSDQKESVKNKVYFIHMNHTNPLLDPKSNESKWVLSKGFRIAQIGQVFEL